MDRITNRKQLKRELKNKRALLECALQFGLVGDPTRMKICWLLCKHPELSVTDIAEMLGVSVSVVSHALRKLRTHKLVTARRDYKQVFYSLSRTSFSQFVKKEVGKL